MVLSNVKYKVEDGPNLCGLLRISELYCLHIGFKHFIWIQQHDLEKFEFPFGNLNQIFLYYLFLEFFLDKFDPFWDLLEVFLRSFWHLEISLRSSWRLHYLIHVLFQIIFRFFWDPFYNASFRSCKLMIQSKLQAARPFKFLQHYNQTILMLQFHASIVHRTVYQIMGYSIM